MREVKAGGVLQFFAECGMRMVGGQFRDVAQRIHALGLRQPFDEVEKHDRHERGRSVAEHFTDALQHGIDAAPHRAAAAGVAPHLHQSAAKASGGPAIAAEVSAGILVHQFHVKAEDLRLAARLHPVQQAGAVGPAVPHGLALPAAAGDAVFDQFAAFDVESACLGRIGEDQRPHGIDELRLVVVIILLDGFGVGRGEPFFDKGGRVRVLDLHERLHRFDELRIRRVSLREAGDVGLDEAGEGGAIRLLHLREVWCAAFEKSRQSRCHRIRAEGGGELHAKGLRLVRGQFFRDFRRRGAVRGERGQHACLRAFGRGGELQFVRLMKQTGGLQRGQRALRRPRGFFQGIAELATPLRVPAEARERGNLQREAQSGRLVFELVHQGKQTVACGGIEGPVAVVGVHRGLHLVLPGLRFRAEALFQQGAEEVLHGSLRTQAGTRLKVVNEGIRRAPGLAVHRSRHQLVQRRAGKIALLPAIDDPDQRGIVFKGTVPLRRGVAFGLRGEFRLRAGPELDLLLQTVEARFVERAGGQRQDLGFDAARALVLPRVPDEEFLGRRRPGPGELCG